MEGFLEQRQEVAHFMNRLYQRGLTTVSGGNISYRLNEELFCITPSSLDKSCLEADMIAIVGFDGTNHTPHLRLSIESEMHRLLLLERTDVNAVVHSHPIYCSVFSASEGPCLINTRLTAESYFFIKEVVNVPYALMGTEDLARNVVAYGKSHDVMLMQNHGAITLGTSLLTAFDKIDLLERSAQMTLAYDQLKGMGLRMKDLDASQLKELEELG